MLYNTKNTTQCYTIQNDTRQCYTIQNDTRQHYTEKTRQYKTLNEVTIQKNIKKYNEIRQSNTTQKA